MFDQNAFSLISFTIKSLPSPFLSFGGLFVYLFIGYLNHDDFID